MGNSFLRKINFKIVLPILLAITILLTSSVVFFTNYPFRSKPTGNNNVTSNTSSTDENIIPVYNKKVPKAKHTATITPGVDFKATNSDFKTVTEEIKLLVESIAKDKFDSINVVLNTDKGLIVSDLDDRLNYIKTYAKSYGMTVITTISLSKLYNTVYNTKDDLNNIFSILTSRRLLDNTDMLILDDFYLSDNTTKLTEAMTNIYYTIAKSAPELYVGIKCKNLYTKSIEDANDFYMLDNGFADVRQWAIDGIIDFVVIDNPYPTSAKNVNFENVVNHWQEIIGDYADIYYLLSYSKLGTNDTGWKKTDEIIKQIMALDGKNYKGFMLDSYNSFKNGDSDSRNTVLKFIAGQINDKYILTDLSITSPTKTTMTTYNNTIAFIGASDPSFSLEFNGKPVERNDLGYFSFDQELKIGLNTFNITHKGITTTYKITYKKVVIKSYSPTTKMSIEGGSTIVATAIVLKGSNVTATFNGNTITLTEEPLVYENGTIDAEYSYYSGSFTLPVFYDENKDLGKITINAKSNYGNESESSGRITVIKSVRPVSPKPTPTLPQGGNYVDVGNNLIAEVVLYQAETFNVADKADFSRPTNNYLPKGTVDYCSDKIISYGSEHMRTLRYGKNLYTRHNNTDNIKVYEGTLPDHNELNVSKFDGSGKHSVLTLDVLWKAPFMLELKEQKYVNEGYGSDRNYSLVNNTPTFSYVDITFCYSTVLTGELTIPEDNKLFSKAEWIKNEADYTLRLYLKKVGAFYGWTAEYNDKGQLEFYFLNPSKITAAENKYGYSLDGITVLLNVGHGGNDSGAGGSNPNYTEEILNLILAEKVKAELESIGATVVMDRTDNTTAISNDERCELIHKTKPDYVLAIHRNSSDKTTPRGFQSFFFNAYSYMPSKLLFDKTIAANLYQDSKWNKVDRHLYFVSRVSACPIVLTENGFMSNSSEYSDMIKDDFNAKCAVALTEGIIEHFKSIQ